MFIVVVMLLLLFVVAVVVVVIAVVVAPLDKRPFSSFFALLWVLCFNSDARKFRAKLPIGGNKFGRWQ